MRDDVPISASMGYGPDMGFRDGETAARERAQALEHELSEARVEVERLRSGASAPAPPRRIGRGGAGYALALGLLAVALGVGAWWAGYRVGGREAEQVGIVLGLCAAVVLNLAVIAAVVSTLLIVVRPDEIAVLSGRQYRKHDGTVVGYRVVTGGRVLRIPILETADILSTRLPPIAIQLFGVYTKGGARVTCEAAATVKVAAEEPHVHNAVERFLGRSPDRIALVARETLEGAVRQVLAQLTPEEAESDRERLAVVLMEEAEHDLSKLGLVLDAFRIEKITGA